MNQRMKVWKLSPIEHQRKHSNSNNSTDDMVYTDPQVRGYTTSSRNSSAIRIDDNYPSPKEPSLRNIGQAFRSIEEKYAKYEEKMMSIQQEMEEYNRKYHIRLSSQSLPFNQVMKQNTSQSSEIEENKSFQFNLTKDSEQPLRGKPIV